MGNIMKSGKVVLILSGRYAGRKGIIIKNYDDGTSETQYGHAMVAGIARYPRKVHKRMGKQKIHKRSKIKALHQDNALQPFNAHSLLRGLGPRTEKIRPQGHKGPHKEKKERFQTRIKFEERYMFGNNKWFFQKLRF